MVEEKKDVAAFTNYKDESGAPAPVKPQEKKIEMKVEAITQSAGPSHQKTQSASAEKTSSGSFYYSNHNLSYSNSYSLKTEIKYIYSFY